MARSLDLVKIIETHLKNGDRSQSVPAIAEEFGFTTEAVGKWLKMGLPSVRLGRTHWVCWQDLADWIEYRSPKTPAPKGRPNNRAAKWLASRGLKIG